MKLALTAVLVGWVTAGSANAATVLVHLDGYLESQIGPGQDANLKVGDKVTLTATYDTANSFYLGPNIPYQIAAPTTLNITTGGADHWSRIDEINDGSPLFAYDEYYFDPDGTIHVNYQEFGAPLLAIQNGKVVSVSGFFLPTMTAVIPAVDAGNSIGGGIYKRNNAPGEPVVTTYQAGASLNPVFNIQAYNAYGNTAQTPGFLGRWDFANSTAAVPEPSTWSMLIIGFGGVGVAMRARRRRKTLA